MQLPYTEELEIQYLSRLFDNTSECYKFFWFQAIITKVLEDRTSVSYEELVNEMIADAWYMITEYHLNLGPRDNLEALVHYIQSISQMKSSEKKTTVIDFLKRCTDKEVSRRKLALTKHVPYRLQAPFMKSLKGSEWQAPERVLVEKINQEKRLLYYFNALNGLKTTISFQKDWVAYIHKNQGIIKGWLQYHRILYLQKRNPSVPGIADKLYPPQERKLEKVKKYWKLLIEMQPIQEIFGHVLLDGKNLSIDHFIPWSYVAHDEFWNLHPTTRNINIRKSNYLPDWDIYFPKLAEQEFGSYKMMWKYDSVRTVFEQCAREHLNNDTIRQRVYRQGLSYTEFTSGLSEVMKPVYQSAMNCGFQNWVYSAEKDRERLPIC